MRAGWLSGFSVSDCCGDGNVASGGLTRSYSSISDVSSVREVRQSHTCDCFARHRKAENDGSFRHSISLCDLFRTRA